MDSHPVHSDHDQRMVLGVTQWTGSNINFFFTSEETQTCGLTCHRSTQTEKQTDADTKSPVRKPADM